MFGRNNRIRRRRRVSLADVLAFAMIFAHSATSRADIGATPSPDDLWQQWSFDPLLLAAITLSTCVYALGLARIWHNAGTGRGITRARATCFFGGLSMLLLAIASPLDALGTALFSAHMLQHLVLITFVAPLLVLGRPLAVGLWALPKPRRVALTAILSSMPLRYATRSLRQPVLVLGLHTVTLWLWHAPHLYEAALENAWVHAFEHLSFTATSVLYWWAVLEGRASKGARIVVLFAGATAGALLGALMTVSPVAWYGIHDPGCRAWGLDPLEDQQLAGLIMWVPGNLAYLAAALTSFAAWLSESERAVRRARRARRSREEPCI